MSGNIITPLGEIKLFIDGFETEYIPIKGPVNEKLFPDVLGRYQIIVNYFPDGAEHEIVCKLDSDEKLLQDNESGECMEAIGLYSYQTGNKVSIASECDFEYIAGQRMPGLYDFDVEWTRYGLLCRILPESKTEKHTFMVSWIDNVTDDEAGSERAFQAEEAVDPFLWKETVHIRKNH